MCPPPTTLREDGGEGWSGGTPPEGWDMPIIRGYHSCAKAIDNISRMKIAVD